MKDLSARRTHILAAMTAVCLGVTTMGNAGTYRYEQMSPEQLRQAVQRCPVAYIPAGIVEWHGEQSACELQLRLDDQRAQFGPRSLHGFASNQQSLREGGAPHGAGNYAIENLIDVDRPFMVRVIVKGDDKLGGTLIDAEIAEKRTLLSYRPNLTVKKMTFRVEDVELGKVHIARIEN